MSGGGSSHGDVGFKSGPEELRSYFAERIAQDGGVPSVYTGGATPQERSKVVQALNLAAGDVLGGGDISRVQLSPSRGTGLRLASFGGVKVPVSENPTDAELRGAAAAARAARR